MPSSFFSNLSFLRSKFMRSGNAPHPVSATKKELYHFDFYKPIILKYENFVNKKYKNNELIYLLLSFFVEYLQKCRNIAILNEKEYTNMIGGDSFDL